MEGQRGLCAPIVEARSGIDPGFLDDIGRVEAAAQTGLQPDLDHAEDARLVQLEKRCQRVAVAASSAFDELIAVRLVRHDSSISGSEMPHSGIGAQSRQFLTPYGVQASTVGW